MLTVPRDVPTAPSAIVKCVIIELASNAWSDTNWLRMVVNALGMSVKEISYSTDSHARVPMELIFTTTHVKLAMKNANGATLMDVCNACPDTSNKIPNVWHVFPTASSARHSQIVSCAMINFFTKKQQENAFL